MPPDIYVRDVPPPPTAPKSRKRLVLMFGVIALFAFAFWYGLKMASLTTSGVQEGVNVGESIRLGTAPIPPLTPQVQEKVASSKGFDRLVVFSDAGFPSFPISIKVGQTVRITNNSSAQIQLAIDRVQDETLAPQEFWEQTFEKQGIYKVEAILTGKSIDIHVQ